MNLLQPNERLTLPHVSPVSDDASSCHALPLPSPPIGITDDQWLVTGPTEPEVSGARNRTSGPPWSPVLHAWPCPPGRRAVENSNTRQ